MSRILTAGVLNQEYIVIPSPTPTMTPTITPTITPTNTVTPTVTPTNTISPAITVTPSITPSKALTTLKSGLLSCWNFDESSGSILYDKYGTDNGIINGTVTYNQPGIVSDSIYFNASSEYISFDKKLISSYPFSVSCWVNITQFIANQLPLFISNGYLNYYYGFAFNVHSNSVSISFGNGISAGSNGRKSYYYNYTINLNEWYHIVVTSSGFNADNNKFYINGQPVIYSYTDGTGTYIDWSNGYTYFLRHIALSNTIWADSKANQMSLWNKVLTIDEISMLYNSGNGFPYSSW